MNKYYTNVKLHKNKFLVKAIENGKRVSYKVPCKPYLFLESKNESEYHTLQGKSVEKIEFDSSWEQHEFVKKYEDVENFKFYGMTDSLYVWIHDNFPKEIKYNFDDINIVTLDIEVNSENGFGNIETADREVTAITMRSRGKNLVFGCQEFRNDYPETTQYIHCENEEQLLKLFLTAWNDKQWAPDIVTGWNTNGYDIPYLVHRISRILSESAVKMLSPWGIVISKEYTGKFGKQQEEFELVGISSLDYLQLYRKFSYTPQESYRLDHIAFEECGERKLDYSEYGGTLATLYSGNFDVEKNEKTEPNTIRHLAKLRTMIKNRLSTK